MPTPLQIQKVKKQPPPTKPKPSSPSIFRESVEVYGRLRPLKNLNDKVIVHKVNDEILEIAPPSPLTKYRFKFKHLLDHTCSQREVFNKVGAPLVHDLIHGKNGLIFTYGISGSGKTHTITGNPQDCGLLPRVLDMVFNTLDRNNLQSVPYIFKSDSQNGFEIIQAPDALQKIQENLIFGQMSSPRTKRKNKLSEMTEWENRIKEDSFVKDIDCDLSYGVFVSYIEIYNNFIYDLLDDQPIESHNVNGANGLRAPRLKRIMEDGKKRYYVQGVKEIEVRSANEACELFIRGTNRRKTGITEMNNESSRSHSIFTIRIVQAPLDLEGVLPIDNKKLIRVGQLSIVDLAGCERTGRTKATGDRLKEASQINNSLLTLRKCFDLLRDNQKYGSSKQLVPYRDSKLTHLFKSYFEGDGRVKMVICINPGLEDYDETIQVCKFAETSQELTTVITTKNLGVSRYPFRMVKCIKSNVDYASMMIPTITFPDELLTNPDDDEIIPRWQECLQKQLDSYADYMLINKQNQMNVRDSIVEMETELTLLRQDNQELKMDLECREMQLRDYEVKFSQMDREMAMMEGNVKKLAAEKSRLNNQLNEAQAALTQMQNHLNNLRKNVAVVLKVEHDKIKKLFLETVNLKEKEIKEKQRCQEEKFEILLRCLNDDTLYPETLRLLLSPLESVFSISRHVAINRQNVSTRSKTPEFKRTQTSPKAVYNYVDPDTMTSLPVINPKYRRSLSTGTHKWIDHRPMKTLELGTVLQPSIKNKKSVTKLKASDFLDRKNGASKYVLTHHEATRSGNVETKVFKGDVIPSSAGGAQIIFKDVEMLKQESPVRLFSK